MFFFFNDTATTEIYTLSLHDALPIYRAARESRATSCALRCEVRGRLRSTRESARGRRPGAGPARGVWHSAAGSRRSEEHTSELQSRQYLVCRLLLEKKKKHTLGLHYI